MKQQPDQPGELHDCPPHMKMVHVRVSYTETIECEANLLTEVPLDATDEEIRELLDENDYWFDRVQICGDTKELAVEHREVHEFTIVSQKAKDNAPKDV